MIAVQVAAGLDEPTAGPSYSVPNLAKALASEGVQAPLHCVLGWRGAPRPDLEPRPQRHRQDAARAPFLNALCLSGDLHRALRAAAPTADLFHAHGLWLMPDIYPAWVARAAGKPFVLSPRGMLGGAALAFSSLRKQLVWRLLQGPAARGAACLHATSPQELAEIRAFGLTGPVAVIPNGVEVRASPRPLPTGPRTVITIGRIHPIKGLPDLIQAWRTVQDRFPDWRLRIVGPDEDGHAGELAGLIRHLDAQRISIEPPLFGEDKAEGLETSDLFILATHSENFAMSVAEALAAGVPVVATKGAPWNELDSRGAGWWVDIGAEPLARALAVAMSRPRDELAAMGEAGRRWMGEAFSWRRAASDMAALYRWLCGQGDRPASVQAAD